ncbi:hypothetical protein BC828DRAFT_112983 [Blastocladiella britannica]|nr:hypothetical protein BC828DRAFT_112983 [Blastocladiella britannica]
MIRSLLYRRVGGIRALPMSTSSASGGGAPKWTVTPNPTATPTPRHIPSANSGSGSGSGSGSNADADADAAAAADEGGFMSIPIYLAAAALFGWSVHHVQTELGQPGKLSASLDPFGQPFAVSKAGVSETAQEDDAREASLLGPVLDADAPWLARLRNWWTYPASVRDPLRWAVFYHVYAPDAARAEAFYLQAVDAAAAAQGRLDLEAGIALQMARFYADQRAPVPALRWYHVGIERLVAWYAADDERIIGRLARIPWASAVGAEKLDRVAAVYAGMARAAAYLEVRPDAAQVVAVGQGRESANPPNWGTDRYYSMALAAAMLGARVANGVGAQEAEVGVDAAVRSHLGHLLRGAVPPEWPEPHSDAVTVASARPPPVTGTPTLVALLEEMAEFYALGRRQFPDDDENDNHDVPASTMGGRRQPQPAYAAALRRVELALMPGSDARDVACRRALVMNNLADDLVAEWYVRVQQATADSLSSKHKNSGGSGSVAVAEAMKDAATSPLLREAAFWLARSQAAAADKTVPECALCHAVALNNAGRVAELAGDREEAMRAFKQAVTAARKNGLVDVRREAQANLGRLEEDRV